MILKIPLYQNLLRLQLFSGTYPSWPVANSPIKYSQNNNKIRLFSITNKNLENQRRLAK